MLWKIPVLFVLRIHAFTDLKLLIYDTLPGKILNKWNEGYFEENIILPGENKYLFVEVTGTPITIMGTLEQPIRPNDDSEVVGNDGEGGTENPEPPWLDNDDILLYVINAPPNIPYQIIRNSVPIVSGMSDEHGRIVVTGFDKIEPVIGGMLHLYPDSLAERAQPWHTLVFDDKNRNTLHPDSEESLIYTPQAYAKIFVTGDIEVTNFNLDGTLPIPYLNKKYVGGGLIWVPIIPGHKAIQMDINGMSTTLLFEAIRDTNGITVAKNESSTIKVVNPTRPIHYAEATVGTTAFAIATYDGTLNAIISETIEGNIEIKNYYKLNRDPPPPPPPRGGDPLSGYVDVYVNGKLVDNIHLGENPFPPGLGRFATPNPTGFGTSVIERSVEYTYPPVVLAGTAIVDVKTGDFVEFYVYAHINGDIDEYDVPDRYRLVSQSGESTAIVTILSASINTGMQ